MLKGLVLVGGKSSRMGEPKHLLKRDGVPQYQYISELVLSCGIQPYISCNKSQLSSLKGEHPLIVDTTDSIGPLGGIASAFEKDPKASWLVIACDLLNLTKEAIADLKAANTFDHDVSTYQKKGSLFLETTLTIYNPASAYFIEESVRSNDYSLQSLLKKCRVKTLEVSTYDFLKNVNSKSDLPNL